ncbi:uncharacterized protein V1518DRAFT_424894 [Limtongia smithiae]|uniref:uncharacterized protein n=1 Tax=Limtongia smithiae TaxID=1125753 RepID=UPI0034CFF3FA
MLAPAASFRSRGSSARKARTASSDVSDYGSGTGAAADSDSDSDESSLPPRVRITLGRPDAQRVFDIPLGKDSIKHSSQLHDEVPPGVDPELYAKFMSLQTSSKPTSRTSSTRSGEYSHEAVQGSSVDSTGHARRVLPSSQDHRISRLHRHIYLSDEEDNNSEVLHSYRHRSLPPTPLIAPVSVAPSIPPHLSPIISRPATKSPSLLSTRRAPAENPRIQPVSPERPSSQGYGRYDLPSRQSRRSVNWAEDTMYDNSYQRNDPVSQSSPYHAPHVENYVSEKRGSSVPPPQSQQQQQRPPSGIWGGYEQHDNLRTVSTTAQMDPADNRPSSMPAMQLPGAFPQATPPPQQQQNFDRSGQMASSPTPYTVGNMPSAHTRSPVAVVLSPQPSPQNFVVPGQTAPSPLPYTDVNAQAQASYARSPVPPQQHYERSVQMAAIPEPYAQPGGNMPTALSTSPTPPMPQQQQQQQQQQQMQGMQPQVVIATPPRHYSHVNNPPMTPPSMSHASVQLPRMPSAFRTPPPMPPSAGPAAQQQMPFFQPTMQPAPVSMTPPVVYNQQQGPVAQTPPQAIAQPGVPYVEQPLPGQNVTQFPHQMPRQNPTPHPQAFMNAQPTLGTQERQMFMNTGFQMPQQQQYPMQGQPPMQQQMPSQMHMPEMMPAMPGAFPGSAGQPGYYPQQSPNSGYNPGMPNQIAQPAPQIIFVPQSQAPAAPPVPPSAPPAPAAPAGPPPVPPAQSHVLHAASECEVCAQLRQGNLQSKYDSLFPHSISDRVVVLPGGNAVIQPSPSSRADGNTYPYPGWPYDPLTVWRERQDLEKEQAAKLAEVEVKLKEHEKKLKDDHQAEVRKLQSENKELKQTIDDAGKIFIVKDAAIQKVWPIVLSKAHTWRQLQERMIEAHPPPYAEAIAHGFFEMYRISDATNILPSMWPEMVKQNETYEIVVILPPEPQRPRPRGVRMLELPKLMISPPVKGGKANPFWEWFLERDTPQHLKAEHPPLHQPRSLQLQEEAAASYPALPAPNTTPALATNLPSSAPAPY